MHVRNIRDRKRVALGLADIEDVDDAEARHELVAVRLDTRRSVFGLALRPRRDDRDATFATADLSVELPPGAVASDVGRVGTLRCDEQLVAQAVAAELGRTLKSALPTLAATQSFGLTGQSVEQMRSIGGRHRAPPRR